jgi:glutamyl-tRNA synthetase
MNIDKLIKKWALFNAWKYNGSASVGAVVGKLLADHPELKPELKTLSKKIANIVEDVNSTPVEKQIFDLKKIAPELMEEKKIVEEKKLKPLPNAVNGKVIMRFAPSPSGPLHIGHAFVLSLNSEYCRMYDGKLIIRIEDTNPENIYEPAYKQIPEDAKWLTKNNVAKVVVQSERLHTYYDYAEKILTMGKAYVCSCSQDIFKELIEGKKACPCRELPVKEQLKRWDKMFNGYEPGEAVVRIKTNIAHPNPAMRDWPALRINHTKHPKTGTEEKVWPLMNFSVAIDDHELGITHTIRGKDHVDNEKRQAYLFEYFGWKKPTHLYFGRINFEGLELSCTKTKQMIQEGKYSDWDDIRLPFLPALRRRGYQPDAFIRYAIDMGVNMTDKTVSAEEFFKALDAYNTEIIDPAANRYFFVNNPVKIEIETAPGRTVELEIHPGKKEGIRKFKTASKFYVSNDDFAKIKANKMYRLMDCLNFVKKGKKFVFDSADHETYKERGEAIMHWLPAEADAAAELVKVDVLMPDNTILSGLGEPAMKKLKVGNIVQLERRFFARLDEKTKDKLTFWYTHK